MKYLIALISLIFFFVGSSQAQLLTNYIPKDAEMVMEIDLNSIQKNLGDQVSNIHREMDLKLLGSYKSKVKLSDLFDTEKSGVDMSRKAYYFKDGKYKAWTFPLSKADQFIIFLKSKMEFDSITSDNLGVTQLTLANSAVFIKNNTAILLEGPYVKKPYLSSYSVKRELTTYLYAQEESVSLSPMVTQKITDLIMDHAMTNKYSLPSDFKAKLNLKMKLYLSKLELSSTESEMPENEVIAMEIVRPKIEEVEAAVDAVADVEVAIDAAEDAAEDVDGAEYSESASLEKRALKLYYFTWDYYRQEVHKKYYKEEMENTTLKAWNYFNQSAAQSIESNFKFTSEFSHQHDIGVWVEPKQIFTASELRFLNLGSYFEGQNSTAYMDVEGNKIRIAGEAQANSTSANYKSIKSKRVNKKFCSFLPASTSAVYAMNVDLNESYAWYQDFYSQILKDAGKKEDMDFSGFIDIFDLLIDKEVLLETWKGDGLLAFTGTTSFVSTKKEYVYDSVDYQRTWKTVPDTMNIPEVLGMFSIGNKDHLNRMLDAMVKLRVLKKQGNEYLVDMNYSDYDRRNKGLKEMWKFYIEGNILFVTNSSDGKMEKTKEGPEYINALLKKQGNFFYWNHAKSIDNIALAPRMMRELAVSKEYFQEAYIKTSQAKSGAIHMDAEFRFLEENKTNALVQLMQMIAKMD